MKKAIRKILSLTFIISLIYIQYIVKAEETQTKEFESIVYEDFDKIQNAFWDESIFWANNGNVTTDSSEVINGTKSLKYIPSSTTGDWTDLGGTSEGEVLIQNGKYKISFDVKVVDVDFLIIKLNTKDEITYHEFIFNPLTGKKLDGNGNEVDLSIGESIVFNNETKVSQVSFEFTADKSINSYISYTSRTSGSNPYIIFDDFDISKEVKNISYRTISEDNFNNSEGPVHSSSLFWVNNDEGTTGEFTSLNNEVIEGKSLKFNINKLGWDILGGSQGDKLKITGGQKYRISFDIKLVNSQYFTMKLKTISNPELTLYDMYINEYGKRLPGSKRISGGECVTYHDEIISVNFTFSSDMAFNSYLYLNAYANDDNAYVILDNVKIEEEIVNIPYISYTDYYKQDFENITSENEVLTDTGLLSGDNAQNVHLINQNEMVIRNDSSLSIEPTKVMKWNEVLKTDYQKVEINNNLYKFHFKARFTDIYQVKVQVVQQDNLDIIHEFYFDTKTLRRIQSIGDAYLDNGKLTVNDGVVVGYFELPNLESDKFYYISINVLPTSTNGKIIFDDINVLKQLVKGPIDETTYIRPGGVDSPTKLLPTGIGDASNMTSMLKGVDTIGITITIIVSLVLVTSGIIFISINFKKRTYKNNFKRYIVLLTILIVGCVSFLTGYFTITPKSSIDDIIKSNSDIDNYNIIYPEKISGHLDNAGMGWVSLEEPTYGGHPDLGSSGNLPEIDNISISTSWALIEKEEGDYDFTLVDQVIDYYTQLGKHINLRICTDSLMLPNTYKGVPTWLIEKYNIPYETVNYTDSGPVGTYKVIDLRDPNYRKYLGLFLNALKEKYKDNHYVDVVEIRGYGNWGEWHSGFTFDSINNRINSLTNIIDQYDQAFKDTGKLLVLSAAWDPQYTPYDTYDDYVNNSAFNYLMTLPNATFRRDSGGNLLNYSTDERLLSDVFRSGKRLPLLGEYASGIDAALNNSYGFDLMGGLDDILYKMRPNYSTVLGWVNMNAAWLVDHGYSDFLERGNEKLGYRLAVDVARYPKTVAPGNEFTLMTSFSNSGVGRFSYKYPLKIQLLDSNENEVASCINTDFDARTFVLGEVNNVYSQFNIPDNLSDGNYKLAISIVDDNHNPAIKLGMAGEIGNTRRYLLGNIKIDKNASVINDLSSKTDYNSIDQFRFKPFTTYMVTFKYKPGFDLANLEFGNYDGYAFALTSKTGGDSATVGYNKWQDVSGETGYKTFVFTTQDYHDYKLNITSEGFSDIDVMDIYVEEIGGYYEHFEDYDFSDSNSIYYPLNTKNARISSNSDEIITGESSVIIESKSKGDKDALKIDTNVYQLKPNTTYTISYKFKNLSMVGKGGYMYLNLEDEINNTASRIGEWYERDDTPFTTKTFTFTTSESNKQTIAFGMHNGGKYAIDDLILTEQASGKIINGNDIISSQNVRPNIDFGGIGTLEDFEDLSFNQCSFNWGYFGWGQFSFDPNYVISGNSSLMGKIEPDALENEWFEFANSKIGVYNFKPNATYTVEFKYRILSNPVNDGRFYMLFRSKQLGVTGDSGYIELPQLNDNELGQIRSFKQDITIGDATDYQLIFGMHWLGTIVIDDVLITEKTN